MTMFHFFIAQTFSLVLDLATRPGGDRYVRTAFHSLAP
jgi:hypothetical protein